MTIAEMVLIPQLLDYEPTQSVVHLESFTRALTQANEQSINVVAFWLISIQIFGAVVFVQNGATARVLFITATIHL